MKVSEIFYSVQGEGPNIGVPSVFLRLAVCNLRCSWCDTKYTWDWNNYDYDKEVAEMKMEEVRERILQHNCKHLVITGGEPMLQQQEVGALLTSLKEEDDFYAEIETNGTIAPNGCHLEEIMDQWNVSPKTSNSGNSQELREIPKCYEYFRKMPNAYFKYVVKNEHDLSEILELVSKYDLPRSRMILMPEAVTESAIREKSGWLVERCKSEGFRFSTRLHIILYGNKRAV